MDASDAGTAGALTPLSTAFSGLRELALSRWAASARETIPAARELEDAALTSHLPILYDDIAEALTPGYPRAWATSGSNLACAHGRDRANLTAYSPGDVVHELQLFHDVILATAAGAGLALGVAERAVIDKSIDNAIREAVVAFTATTLDIGQMFMASLSHDIRNPLGVVGCCVQLIRRQTDSREIAVLADRMHVQLREVDAMLQTLLDATVYNGRHKLNLDIGAFELKTLVEESCRDMPADTNACLVEGDGVTGFWCRAALKRALQNLLSNANKYGKPGSVIGVRVKRIDHRVFVSVHNDGPPIPPGEIERMFSAFQRLGGVDVKGWGLGLPFVRNVAESHNGTVLVDSAQERGTTFTLSLPLDCRP